MIVVTLALVAAAVTASVSCSVYVCLESRTHSVPQVRTVCHLRKEDIAIRITNSRLKLLCRFEKISSSTVVHNIYRQCGVLRGVGSGKILARFYKNTVGKGGYIEVWPNKAIEQTSIMLSILSRFQPSKHDVESTKIFISSKLSGDIDDVVIGDSERYQWSTLECVLRRDGHNEHALTLDTKDQDDLILSIYNKVIDSHLAVCVAIFFALQKRR